MRAPTPASLLPDPEARDFPQGEVWVFYCDACGGTGNRQLAVGKTATAAGAIVTLHGGCQKCGGDGELRLRLKGIVRREAGSADGAAETERGAATETPSAANAPAAARSETRTAPH